MQENLFNNVGRDSAPLAERLRPQRLEDIIGQDHLLGASGVLSRLVAQGDLPSMILWGPPGCGKTTLARLLAGAVGARLSSVSAVQAGVKDLRAIIAHAADERRYQNKRTLLFIDEIHRFNKAQQDALLPHVESGVITLIGATTENPSFEVNSALLSRSRVFVLEALTETHMASLIHRGMKQLNGGQSSQEDSPQEPQITAEAQAAIIALSHGDARRALTTLEVAYSLWTDKTTPLDKILVEEAAQHRALTYDKAGDAHYGIVSAFIKSMRGSDPNASIYWMVRMLEAGEDPRFLLRRMVIFASEDVGNADPQALSVATAALRAFELVGLPEGSLALTQTAAYLACAPKSNAILKAYAQARAEVRAHGPLPVPKKLVNATSPLDKRIGRGKNYKYPHNFDGHYVAEDYLPDALVGHEYYTPSEQGYELEIRKRMNALRNTTQPSEPSEHMDEHEH